MRRFIFSTAVAALYLAALPAAAQQPAANALPPGDGRDLVAAACTQCHALTVILAMRDGPIGWKRHVHHMVMRGAQLNARETDTVLAYLDANFGPGQRMPPAKPVALPAGPGKELVEARCTACHDLERVASAKRQKSEWPALVANMVSRGAVATPDEAQAISVYLASHFGGE
jgi:cytochrome c5